MQLPFNLPEEHVRVAGQLPSETEEVFENKVGIMGKNVAFRLSMYTIGG